MKNLTKLLLAASLVATLSTSVFALPPFPPGPIGKQAITVSNVTPTPFHAEITRKDCIEPKQTSQSIEAGQSATIAMSYYEFYSKDANMEINILSQNNTKVCTISVNEDGNKTSITPTTQTKQKCVQTSANTVKIETNN